MKRIAHLRIAGDCCVAGFRLGQCARLISEIQRGTYLEPNKTTVAQFLERWLDDIKPRVTPKTHERYEQVCRKNIAPLLGAVVLSKLKPAQISQACAKALASGRRNGDGGLSPRTAITCTSS
jgi:Phage integrase, N-terminal SAM-like domain